jgi:sugar lactone lactonase YvrE
MKTLQRNPRFTAILALFLAAVYLAPAAGAQNVTTVAGGFVGDGRPANKASFQLPYMVVRDKSGNTYISDTYAQRVRKIDSTGTISAYAGTGIAGYNGDGGPATSATLQYPIGLALDPAGELVIADDFNNRVRKVDSSGNISTLAGNGIAGYSGDGGLATSASLNGPRDLAYDAAGNLYISDGNNNVIRKVDTTGTITTYAGNGTAGFCGDGGLATKACLNLPKGLATDSKGNLYIIDGGNIRVRRVNAAGIITTIAGNGNTGFSGDGGKATLAAIGNPTGLSLNAGVLYIDNAGEARLRNVVLSTGIINTSIGSTPGYDGDNHAPLSTQLYSPYGVDAISSSNILVMDRFNARLRQLSGGVVKTIAGGYIGDGSKATSAAFVLPQSVAFDSAGDTFVAEYTGNRIREIDAAGTISSVAGKLGVSGYSGDGGPATSAELYGPQDAVVDSAGNIYITDQVNNVIRKVDGTTKIISTFSANANFGGGLGFMAFDPSGNLYAADAGACVIWKFDSVGNATVVAGVLFSCGYNGDHISATTAFLNQNWGVAFDAAGNMYIADSVNNRIRKVNTAGMISTFAGDGTACALSTDSCGDGGPPTAAHLNYPLTVAVSGTTVYIADELDLRIRKVAGGIINTYAGTGIQGYNGNGLPALSTNFDDPLAIAVNPLNKALYVVDDVQSRVRRVH